MYVCDICVAINAFGWINSAVFTLNFINPVMGK